MAPSVWKLVKTCAELESHVKKGSGWGEGGEMGGGGRVERWEGAGGRVERWGGARLVSCTHSAPDGQGRKIQGVGKAHLPPPLPSRDTLDYCLAKFSRVASGSLQPGYHRARISS